MPPLDHTTAHHRTTAHRYKTETASHQLTVLYDKGLYRHLRYANPDLGLYRIDLITWPNGLAVRGDGPNFLFSQHPTADLLTLFRESAHGGIKPSYWEQKVRAGATRTYSSDNFRTWLTNWATYGEHLHPGLADAVQEQILDNDDYDLDYEESARQAAENFDHHGHTLRYPPSWEHDFRDWSWEYLWACHAIVDITAAYDRHHAENTPRSPAARNTYLDTEFIASDPTLRGLISLALTDENGTDYYAVNAGMDFAAVAAHPWLNANVLPYLPLTPDGALDHTHPDVKPAEQIAADVAAYFTTPRPARLHAYWGEQDLVRLHQLWDNNWQAMPAAVPRRLTDLQTLADLAGSPELPQQNGSLHHALADARHNRAIHQHLRTLPLTHQD